MNQYKILLAIILLSCSTSANAQLILHKSVIANGGASYSSPGLSADWTVGQTVVNQYTSSGLTITEGFHPIEAASVITPPLAVPAVKNNIVSVSAYPNPTSSILNIAIVQNQPATITIQVLDEAGGVVKNVITLPAQQSVNTEVDMSSLSAGTYIIMVNAGTKEAYTMKVVKQ
jgi:hypothetical protein